MDSYTGTAVFSLQVFSVQVINEGSMLNLFYYIALQVLHFLILLVILP